MNPQVVLEFLRALVILVWSFAAVKVIVANILVNVVVALAAAQYTHSLDLSKLAEFLTRKLLPFVAVYAVCKIFGESAGLGWLAPVVWAIIETTLAANLIDNLIKLGVPLPPGIEQLVSRKVPIRIIGGN